MNLWQASMTPQGIEDEMSAHILSFPIPKTDPNPGPPNESCYYSDSELHKLLQDLIESGHKSLVEVHLIACRDYWVQRESGQ
jgi:hypothetical protein